MDSECPMRTTLSTSCSDSKYAEFLAITSSHLLAVAPKYSSIRRDAIPMALNLPSHPHSQSSTR